MITEQISERLDNNENVQFESFEQMFAVMMYRGKKVLDRMIKLEPVEMSVKPSLVYVYSRTSRELKRVEEYIHVDLL
jgi:uncharacterized pyridoxamine 5'-phosphate oxidase family protein